LRRGTAEQKPAQFFQVFFLNALTLFFINREGITIEIVRQLIEKRIGEVLILQNAKKTQFCQSRLQLRGRWRQCENLSPFFAPRRNFFKICGKENFAVLKIPNKDGATNQGMEMPEIWSFCSPRTRDFCQLLSDSLKIANKCPIRAIRGIAEPFIPKNDPGLDTLAMIGS
jgi:hypothetical protein